MAFIFLGATAQCAVVCVQPEAPPCHHHQAHSCTKPLMAAEHVVSAQVPVPTVFIIRVEFPRPAVRFEIASELERFAPPTTALLKSTILRI